MGARWLVLACATLVAVVGAAGAPPAGGTAPEVLRVAVSHPLLKVRPDMPAEGPRAAELQAARNEFEPFQILLRAARDLPEVDVVAHDLVGPGGNTIAARWTRIYRIDYLDVDTPSSEEEAPGEWPDPLVPRVDAYAQERRNAFPFPLRPGRTRGVWVEHYVPVDTPPGIYSGAVTVSATGLEPIRIPVSLEVWPFALPSTSSLPTSFGISGLSILDAHHGDYTDDDDLYHLTRLYNEAALLHRLSTHGGTMVPPRGQRAGSRWALYWEDLDRELGPFLDGTVFGDDDPLPGARATSAMVRTPTNLEGDDLAAYWRSWADHFEARGWLDRLFLYLWDEPIGPWRRTPSPTLDRLLARALGEPIQDYDDLAELAQLAHEADPRLVASVTEQRIPGLDGVIDRWIPLVNCLELKPGYPSYCEETVSREAYPRLGERSAPWFYQSCGSHGCDDVGGDYFAGWPSYMVDAGPVANRVMQWLAWRYRLGGELYHNMTRAFSSDPWNSVYAHGGNGDGTLFYPGRPDRIGGTQHVPVESLRLKLIREGLEDYEYFVLAAAAGAHEEVDRMVERVAEATWKWSSDPDRLLETRRELAALIVSRDRSLSSVASPGS